VRNGSILAILGLLSGLTAGYWIPGTGWDANAESTGERLDASRTTRLLLQRIDRTGEFCERNSAALFGYSGFYSMDL
jgi:hypothetical protein